jgi:acetyl-CoA C-acetyltransferase
MSQAAYIVDCVRTAGGKRKGTLAQCHPADLGATVLDALLDRTKLDGALVDDVIFGCVSQIGAQSTNIARNAVLASKLPVSVPATTVDRQCGSSQQAIHFAAQAVMSGTQDIVIAGGVEVMSLITIGANAVVGLKAGLGAPVSDKIGEKFPEAAGQPVFSQFVGAELVAKEFGLARAELDAFAAESHARAARAQKAGAFANEIVPVAGKDPKTGADAVLAHDEGVRAGVTAEALGKLKTLQPDGLLTAGSASQITDGASAVLIMNEAGLRKSGLTPRAKIVSLALAGDDPVIMLRAPVPASRAALKKAGLKAADIDLWEINEAFSSVPLAVMKALEVPRSKVNVNGGAIALGHPLGATGAKLMGTLVNALEANKKRYGLLTMCEGGGLANATIIERIDGQRKLEAKL